MELSLKHTQRPKLLEQPGLQSRNTRAQKEAASAAAHKVTSLVCMDAKNHQRYGRNGKEAFLLIFHLVQSPSDLFMHQVNVSPEMKQQEVCTWSCSSELTHIVAKTEGHIQEQGRWKESPSWLGIVSIPQRRGASPAAHLKNSTHSPCWIFVV